jgi:hypothetical protein
MRNSISRRLSLLEQKANVHGSPPPIILVNFVSPGQPCESSRAECDDEAWERMPRETEKEGSSEHALSEGVIYISCTCYPTRLR